jgi:hypothetical protein
MTGPTPELIRQGAGDVSFLFWCRVPIWCCYG